MIKREFESIIRNLEGNEYGDIVWKVNDGSGLDFEYEKKINESRLLRMEELRKRRGEIKERIE